MIKITLLNNDDPLIKEILTTEGLFQLLGGRDKINFLTPKHMTYLLITVDSEIAGLFCLDEQNPILVNGHIALLPRHWGKIDSDAILHAGLQFLKVNTTYKQVCSTVPSPCLHVIKFLTRNEFRVCGTYHNSIIFNDQVVDLILFEKSI